MFMSNFHVFGMQQICFLVRKGYFMDRHCWSIILQCLFSLTPLNNILKLGGGWAFTYEGCWVRDLTKYLGRWMSSNCFDFEESKVKWLNYFRTPYLGLKQMYTKIRQRRRHQCSLPFSFIDMDHVCQTSLKS